MSITYSECVPVALVIHHAMRMRRIILSYMVCVALPTFSTHIISQRARFSKNVTENKRCVLIFSTTFVGNSSHSHSNHLKPVRSTSYVARARSVTFGMGTMKFSMPISI
jgi:hypothetical protein